MYEYIYFNTKTEFLLHPSPSLSFTPDFIIMLRLFLFLLVLLQDLSGFQDSCSLVSGQTPDILVFSFRCIPHQDRFTLYLCCFKKARNSEVVGNVARPAAISQKMFEHLQQTCVICVGNFHELFEEEKWASDSLKSCFDRILPAQFSPLMGCK